MHAYNVNFLAIPTTVKITVAKSSVFFKLTNLALHVESQILYLSPSFVTKQYLNLDTQLAKVP